MNNQHQQLAAEKPLRPDLWRPWGGAENPPNEAYSAVRLREGAEVEAHETLEAGKSGGWYWHHTGEAGDIVAYRAVTPVVVKTLSDVINRTAANEGIGDITSSAVGSGARFNAGKPDLSLIPLRLLSDYYRSARACDFASSEANAIESLDALGSFQESHDPEHLIDALAALGGDTLGDCAHVFDYGRIKYAAWNWAKGMPWSVPLACAARHLVAIIEGEALDAESKKPHRGHAWCNVFMLLEFARNYREGNDLPTRWLTQVRAA